MSRPLRIEFEGAWYHVMNRGLERRAIFRDDKDNALFFNLLGEISKIFGVQIHAYSLMGNHYHLLIHTPFGQLGRAMRHLNGLYTQGFNKRHRRDGPLFRGRYKAILMDEQYFLELVSYIHLNPVKARLVRFAHEHPWTSHGAYFGKFKRPEWLHTEKVLSLIEQIAGEKARQKSLAGSVNEDFLRSISSKKIAVGRKGFAEWVKDNHFSETVKSTKQIAKTQKQIFQRPSARQILQSVAFAHNLKVSSLRERTVKNREARQAALYLLRQAGGLQHKMIAKWLKVSTDTAVAKMFERVKRQLGEDRVLAKQMRELELVVWGNVNVKT